MLSSKAGDRVASMNCLTLVCSWSCAAMVVKRKIKVGM